MQALPSEFRSLQTACRINQLLVKTKLKLLKDTFIVILEKRNSGMSFLFQSTMDLVCFFAFFRYRTVYYFFAEKNERCGL